MDITEIICVELAYRLHDCNSREFKENLSQESGLSIAVIEKVRKGEWVNFLTVEAICSSINLPMQFFKTGPTDSESYITFLDWLNDLSRQKNNTLYSLSKGKRGIGFPKEIPRYEIYRNCKWVEYFIENNSRNKE